jgi:hypothetical protein
VIGRRTGKIGSDGGKRDLRGKKQAVASTRQIRRRRRKHCDDKRTRGRKGRGERNKHGKVRLNTPS